MKEKKITGWDNRKVRELLEMHSGIIKKIIKKKISAFYDVLDINYKTAYEEFTAHLETEAYQALQNPALPGADEKETLVDTLNDLVRLFLAEKTYRHLIYNDQGYLGRIIMDICKFYSIPPGCCPEIEDFIRLKLENQEKLEKVIQKFLERSRFTTYFYKVVLNLVKDYQAKYHTKDVVLVNMDEMKTEALERAVAPAAGPDTRAELEEIRERVNKLDTKEKIAFKLYYFESITNITRIARTLKTSHYKTIKILAAALEKVKQGGV